jgi:glycosyltransferase involved in cell wall biosynthesis
MMVSKACVVGMYQRKLEELARHEDLELTVVVPPYWKDAGRVLKLERQFTSGYALRVESMICNGSYHLHVYPTLGKVMGQVRPDLLHMDEEPYNLATFHAIWLARRRRIPALFFTWQNLFRRYPPPFGLFEGYCFRNSVGALAGNEEAATVLRSKGYKGLLRVVPQFGVDPQLYAARDRGAERRAFSIGYLGRMVREKGVHILLRAVSELPGQWHLRLVGDGPYLPALRKMAEGLGISSRIEHSSRVPSQRMPALLNELDVLVLPSLTQENWKEQFGRILIEAMACEVPVIGSSSGEIPHLIGESGLVFAEGDWEALRGLLARVKDDEELRARLGRKGRDRVLQRYTQQRIASQTRDMYLRCVEAV